MYKQFLLFPQCFQKASFLEASIGVIVWVKLINFLPERESAEIVSSYSGKVFKSPPPLARYLSLYQMTVLDVIRLKAFADGKFNVAKMMIYLLDKVTSIFSFSHNIFKRPLSQGY